MAMNVVQRSTAATAAETGVSIGSGGLEWLDSLPVGGEGTIVLGFKACSCSSGSWWWCHMIHGLWVRSECDGVGAVTVRNICTGDDVFVNRESLVQRASVGT